MGQSRVPTEIKTEFQAFFSLFKDWICAKFTLLELETSHTCFLTPVDFHYGIFILTN